MTDIVERLRACAEGKLCPSVAEEGAAEIERLRADIDRADRMAKINIGVAGKVAEENERLRKEVVRQAHLIVELGAKLLVAEGSPRDRIEQFERDELGGKTLNEFLAVPSSRGQD